MACVKLGYLGLTAIAGSDQDLAEKNHNEAIETLKKLNKDWNIDIYFKNFLVANLEQLKDVLEFFSEKK